MEFLVLCGANAISGGPELAHQLCHAIQENTSYKARMCYVDLNAPADACLPVDISVPEKYMEYNTEHVSNIDEIDSGEQIVIIPEGLTLALVNFTKARVALWWMSVDNYVKATHGADMDRIRDKCRWHLVQSFYARKYVEEHFTGQVIMDLSDYINHEHGKFMLPAAYRQDIVLYNPKKGYDTLLPLMEQVGWIQWIPLRGLNLEKTIFLMQSAKIYIDFGNHPGKDRIPREAAVNGCCVITNKLGSAAFSEDVPIPEKYKFDNPLRELDTIENLMRNICNDMEKYQRDFADYREWIHGEKERFDKEVLRFVDLCSGAV